MSDSNREALAYIKETTFGTTPSTPVWKALRHTGETLGQDTDGLTSNEIRSDRQTTDWIRTNIRGAGGIGFELSYGAYDDFMEYALLADATWVAQVTVPQITASGNTVTIATSGGNSTITRASGSWISDGLSNTNDPNRWISFKSSTGVAGNNSYRKIANSGDTATPVTATVLTVKGVMSAATLTTGTVDVKRGGYVYNGVTLSTMAIYKKFTDLTNKYEILNGMAIDTMNLQGSSTAILTGDWGFLGKVAASASTDGAGASLTAAATNPVYNCVDNLGVLLENSASTGATQWSLNLANGLRARLIMGTLGAVSLGTGECAVSGSFETYFETETIMDKYLNATTSSLASAFHESLGVNAVVFDTPRIEYTAGRRTAGSKNTDIMATLEYTAYRHPVQGFTVQIAKFA